VSRRALRSDGSLGVPFMVWLNPAWLDCILKADSSDKSLPGPDTKSRHAGWGIRVSIYQRAPKNPLDTKRLRYGRVRSWQNDCCGEAED
jgi:hypothetical protein